MIDLFLPWKLMQKCGIVHPVQKSFTQQPSTTYELHSRKVLIAHQTDKIKSLKLAMLSTVRATDLQPTRDPSSP